MRNAHFNTLLVNNIADTQKIYPDVGFGFELDTEKTIVPPVAVHFEPRNNPLLATRFFELLGEKERLHLYDDMRKSLPKNWEPAYFGLFRERPEAPLRVCGYLQKDEVISCKEDPSRIKDIFDKVGFTAFDQTMISQITEVLRIEPAGFDYQFDIYPDGTMGKIFSIEIMLKERSEKSIRKSFEKGAALQILDLMRKYGLAEEKSRLLGEFTFERSVPVELKDGSLAPFHLGFRPKWFKIRWDNTKLVPAKCYFLLQAAFEETFF